MKIVNLFLATALLINVSNAQAEFDPIAKKNELNAAMERDIWEKIAPYLAGPGDIRQIKVAEVFDEFKNEIIRLNRELEIMTRERDELRQTLDMHAIQCGHSKQSLDQENAARFELELQLRDAKTTAAMNLEIQKQLREQVEKAEQRERESKENAEKMIARLMNFAVGKSEL